MRREDQDQGAGIGDTPDQDQGVIIGDTGAGRGLEVTTDTDPTGMMIGGDSVEVPCPEGRDMMEIGLKMFRRLKNEKLDYH